MPLRISKEGTVYLVGAGPGDPGLLTLKGKDCLQRADVVVYDYLANPRLLQLAPVKSKKIYVGKKGSSHSVEQDHINQLLVKEAQKGKTVVRLKGGDPYIFGRGGEEALALRRSQVAFEVVPGVTSAIAVPAYAGIPLTHRDYTSVVAFVTGHEKDTEAPMSPDWTALAKIGTIVFLMSFGNLPRISENLIKCGKLATTPVEVIEWGTLPRQRRVSGTLSNIVARVKEKSIRPPTIVVVGDVASLGGELGWFDRKPLFGKKIMVTRSRHQISEIADRLEMAGAEVIEVPTIEFRPPTSWVGLDRSLKRLKHYSWVLFTSANGVTAFFDRLTKSGSDARALGRSKIGAIGAATAGVIASYGLRADIIAKEFRSEGLITALKTAHPKLKGERVLIVRAKETREMVGGILKKAGAKVDEVEAYRMVLPRKNAPLLKEILERGPDMVVFASSNTARNYLELAKKTGVEILAKKIPAACIGPITRKSAENFGLNVVVQPEQSTMPELVEAIKRYFMGEG